MAYFYDPSSLLSEPVRVHDAWQLVSRSLSFDRPLVMGILNVTPDSFFDGGRLAGITGAVNAAGRLLEEGADLLDIGGESTRPGAIPVDETTELARVLPVIEAILARFPDACLSIDTMKPGVMRRGLAAGVEIVNDVNALQAPGACEVCVEARCGVVLMNLPNLADEMHARAPEQDAVARALDFLSARHRAMAAAGMEPARMVIDPGIGFGQTLAQNLKLMAHIDALTHLAPVLVGYSRKSVFGRLLGLPVEERLSPGLAAAALAVWQGAAIVRTHDVRATRHAVDTAHALRLARQTSSADKSTAATV